MLVQVKKKKKNDLLKSISENGLELLDQSIKELIKNGEDISVKDIAQLSSIIINIHKTFKDASEEEEITEESMEELLKKDPFSEKD